MPEPVLEPGSCPASSGSAASSACARSRPYGTRPARGDEMRPSWGAPVRKSSCPDAKSAGSGAPVGETTAGAPEPDGPLSRRPPAPPPPLRGENAHGQVHPHAPRRRPQDAREGGRAATGTPSSSSTPTPTSLPASSRTFPRSLVERVRLIDLADEDAFPGINLLDTRVFADRDRTADSVVQRRPRALGAVGTAHAVDPRTEREDPARGQRPPRTGGPVHDPRRPAPGSPTRASASERARSA